MWLSSRKEVSAVMSEGNPRKRVQFSLKTLLVLMLIVAAYFTGRIPAERRAAKMEMRAKEQALKAEAMAHEALREAQRAKALADKQLQQINSVKPPIDQPTK